jgi:hypothetical protein
MATTDTPVTTFRIVVSSLLLEDTTREHCSYILPDGGTDDVVGHDKHSNAAVNEYEPISHVLHDDESPIVTNEATLTHCRTNEMLSAAVTYHWNRYQQRMVYNAYHYQVDNNPMHIDPS